MGRLHPTRSSRSGGCSPLPHRGQAAGPPPPGHRNQTRPLPRPCPRQEHRGTPWNPGSCPIPRRRLGELYLASMGIMQTSQEGFQRLKVRREGLPLETPTFPGFANFQGSLFLEQWSQLLPTPGRTHWLENLAEPPSPANTLAVGAQPLCSQMGGHHLRWQSPRLCPTHNSYPRPRERGKAGPPSQWQPPLWSSKPSGPRCAISRHLAGGPGAPRATTRGVTSCCWQGRSRPAQGGVHAIPVSLPPPRHRLGFQLWDICGSGEKRPPSPPPIPSQSLLELLQLTHSVSQKGKPRPRAQN